MAKTKGPGKTTKPPAAKKPAAKKPKKPPAAAKKPAAKKPPAAAKKPPALPSVAVKPKKATAPSLPLPPPPPPPPAQRDELLAPREVGRLLRYGEQFGPHRIDVRMLPLTLPTSTGAIAIMDPAAPKQFRVLDRPVPTPGLFRVMLSVATSSDRGGATERLAAIVIHTGRPPAVKWVVAHYRGQKKPKSPDDLPRLAVSGEWMVILDAGASSPGPVTLPESPTGITPVEVTLSDGRRALALASGDGEFAAYWGVDADDKPVCLVLDFETFSQKDWKAKRAS